MNAKEMLERLDERVRAYTSLLDELAWHPKRSHIETARNLMKDAADFLRLAAQSDAAGDGPVAEDTERANRYHAENNELFKRAVKAETALRELLAQPQTSRESEMERCAKIADQIAINAERRAADHTFHIAKDAASNKAEGARDVAYAIRAAIAALSGKPGGQAGEDGR